MVDGDPRELTIRVAPKWPGTLEFAVIDRGAGVPPGIAAQIFEPFVSSKPGRIGLGLSICRSIIEGHGGVIRFEPNPGGGTVFAFSPVGRGDRCLSPGHADRDRGRLGLRDVFLADEPDRTSRSISDHCRFDLRRCGCLHSPASAPVADGLADGRRLVAEDYLPRRRRDRCLLCPLHLGSPAGRARNCCNPRARRATNGVAACDGRGRRAVDALKKHRCSAPALGPLHSGGSRRSGTPGLPPGALSSG